MLGKGWKREGMNRANHRNQKHILIRPMEGHEGALKSGTRDPKNRSCARKKAKTRAVK